VEKVKTADLGRVNVTKKLENLVKVLSASFQFKPTNVAVRAVLQSFAN